MNLNPPANIQNNMSNFNPQYITYDYISQTKALMLVNLITDFLYIFINIFLIFRYNLPFLSYCIYSVFCLDILLSYYIIIYSIHKYSHYFIVLYNICTIYLKIYHFIVDFTSNLSVQLNKDINTQVNHHIFINPFFDELL